MKNIKRYKVIIFTLLVLCGIIFSSFNTSNAKYFKEEENLRYGLTINKLYKTLTNDDFTVALNNSLSTETSMDIDFRFNRTGYSNDEEYTITVSGCEVSNQTMDSTTVSFKLTCDPVAIKNDTNYILNLKIEDKISGDAKKFTYTDIRHLIPESDFNPPDLDQIIVKDFDNGVIKIPKKYTLKNTETFNKIVKTFMQQYMLGNTSDYPDSNIILAYYSSVFADTKNDVITGTINGLDKSTSTDDRYNIFTINKSILSYANTYDSYLLLSESSSDSGYIFLNNITNTKSAFESGLSYYYSDDDYDSIISYIERCGGISALLAGTPIKGLEYNSTQNTIHILLSSLLPNALFEINTEYDIDVQSSASRTYLEFVNKMQSSLYDEGFITYLTSGYRTYDILSTFSITNSFNHVYYYHLGDTKLLLTISYIENDDKVHVKINEVDSNNNVISLISGVESTSTYGAYTVTSGNTVYYFNAQTDYTYTSDEITLLIS